MEAARRRAILAHYAAQVDAFERIATHNHLQTLPFAVAGEPAPREEPHRDTPPSGREIAVLAEIAAGSSNSDIAHQLVISEETVKTHVRHLLVKLEANNRAHAVAIGYQRGLLRLPPAA